MKVQGLLVPGIGSGELAASGLLAALSEGVIRIDRRGRVVDLNRAAEELTGWSRQEARKRRLGSVYRVSVPGSRETLVEALAADPGPASRSETRHCVLVRRDGSEIEVSEQRHSIRNAAGSSVGAWIVFHDVTELQTLRRRHHWLAAHDPVTGLLNRRELERRLAAALELARAQGRHYVFGYLDIDDFDVVNDTLGQVAADELIRQVAGLIRPVLGEGGTLARLAPDRLGLLLQDTAPHGASRRVAALRRTIARFRFRWRDDALAVAASLGVTTVEAGSGVVEVMAAADAASDVARDHASQTHRFDQHSSGDLRLAEHFGEMRWLSRIHRALKKDQFRLYRQPIVRVGSVAGEDEGLSELLIRMVDEEGRVIAPGSFVPAAERFHLISALDRWVIRTALARLERDRDEGRLTAVAINLSGQSLSESRFLDFVLEQLDARRIEPDQLYFEITETAAVGNLERARRFLSTLHRRGCRFTLDDFGSGLSSFAYLKSLPVDFLKIDGSFVLEMTRDPIQMAIVRSIHQIGHITGLRTIAEAVETEEAMNAVAELGIDFAQGHWIRSPEPWA